MPALNRIGDRKRGSARNRDNREGSDLGERFHNLRFYSRTRLARKNDRRVGHRARHYRTQARGTGTWSNIVTILKNSLRDRTAALAVRERELAHWPTPRPA